MDRYSELILHKKRSEKIELKIKSNNSDLYSGWEITSISSMLNNTYYKSEVLNSLLSLLSQGISPDNIFVLSDSFKIKQQYLNLNKGYFDLDKAKEVSHFYNPGLPIPLFPNKRIILLNKAFNYYKNLFAQCKRYNLIPPSKDPFLKEVFDILILELGETLDIKELSLKYLKGINIPENLKKEEVEIKKEEIESYKKCK